MTDFDAVHYAQEELAALLRSIVELLEQDGNVDQERFFASILSGVENAREAEDLADPFMQLSMSAFMGFAFSAPVAMLLDRLLANAQNLTESLSLDPEELN